MFVAVGAVNEGQAAKPARPRPFARVYVHVVFELVLVGEPLVARLAGERELRDVCRMVDQFVIPHPHDSHLQATEGALLLSVGLPDMDCQPELVVEDLVTLCTLDCVIAMHVPKQALFLNWKLVQQELLLNIHVWQPLCLIPIVYLCKRSYWLI